MKRQTLVGAAALALTLFASHSLAEAPTACPAPGEPIHWRVDYCMMKMETDDEIAVSGCIEDEGKRRFRTACAGNTHFKRRMCELMIRSGSKTGTVADCVKDPAFKGRTVEAGGVGG